MARLSILAICLISALAINFVTSAKLPLEEITDDKPKEYRFVHTFGNRTEGDIVLISSTVLSMFPEEQDTIISLRYPKVGTGVFPSVITYVEFIVEQTSDSSRPYIEEGGIGQRYISVAVEVKQTRLIRHKAYIYGYFE